jgi:hypothetical protein
VDIPGLWPASSRHAMPTWVCVAYPTSAHALAWAKILRGWLLLDNITNNLSLYIQRIDTGIDLVYTVHMGVWRFVMHYYIPNVVLS